MTRPADLKNASVKVYYGYGHKHNLTIYGHVFKNKAALRAGYSNNIFSNILHLLRLFMVRPLGGVKLQMLWGKQRFETTSETDGFFKFEWASDEDVPAGWHTVKIHVQDENASILSSCESKVFVPHITQYAFISDIDDTVLVSHSATKFRRLRTMFTKNPQTRKAFENVVQHYKALALANTTPGVPNPFFYVSSSEWNLYDDLVEFFKYNDLPEGTFLLSQLKRWYQLLKTGKTKHEGKLIRVYRIMEAFPKQRFTLFGDNSQADPFIYETIAKRHPERIFAVYIRNVVEKNAEKTRELMANIESKGIATCLFTSNLEAIKHSQEIGLIP